MERLSTSIKIFAAAFIGAIALGFFAPGTAKAVTVNGYGHYCSMTWPSGGWAFQSDTNGNDPCGVIRSKTDPGGSIQRAGLYEVNGTNTAIVRCGDNTLWMYVGRGNGPLTAAFNSANGHPRCIFTVAPQRLPVFSKNPFGGVTARVTNGFDFAKDLYAPLNVADFGQSGSSRATIVNLNGAERSYGDNHDGYDWVVPEGTAVYALADGVVEASRRLDTGCTNSNDRIQGEVYIRHTVNRNPSTYNEEFIAGYFHLKERADISPGQTVTAGQYLGRVGWVGCSSESHLHFAVYRMTNVANQYRVAFAVPSDETTPNDGWQWGIDPYGFSVRQGVDPWGWRGFPRGALSINLWVRGAQPSLGDWAQ